MAESVTGRGDLRAIADQDVLLRAIEVMGSHDKALRWLNKPIRALGSQTPISLLSTPEGKQKVLIVLGRLEHGVY